MRVPFSGYIGRPAVLSVCLSALDGTLLSLIRYSYALSLASALFFLLLLLLAPLLLLLLFFNLSSFKIKKRTSNPFSPSFSLFMFHVINVLIVSLENFGRFVFFSCFYYLFIFFLFFIFFMIFMLSRSVFFVSFLIKICSRRDRRSV